MKFKNGFTFIEIVAALAILAIGILAVLTVFPVGIESSKKAAVKTKAAILGEMTIERIKATTTFAALADIAKTNFTLAEDPEQNYQFGVSVSDVALATGGTMGQLKMLVVTVFWPARETDPARQQQMVFTTYVGNR